ncbi:Homeodomain-like protein, partial [Gaertneriomyces semiglobifer]
MNGITETSAHDAFDSGSSLDLNAERRASHSTTCSDSANDDDTGAEAGRPSPVNKKRARATREQLAILEDTFLTNTSPNAKLRAILSKKLNMTERSIQIWFQNRRAKVK